jgi:DNA-binding NarL/FixJ family response regulator
MCEIRIVIVDDHSLFREGLGRLLETTPGLSVVGKYANPDQVISTLSRTPADVVLLDYDLGDNRASGFIAELKARDHKIKVLMVTAGMSDTATLQMMEAGASGVCLKQSHPDRLIEAIHKVANNEIWLDSDAVRSLVSARSARTEQMERGRPLTKRQGDVLRGILDGLTNKEIAWNLKASESAIKAVIQELFQKAGVRTRSQLVRIAIERHASDWLQPNQEE